MENQELMKRTIDFEVVQELNIKNEKIS